MRLAAIIFLILLTLVGFGSCQAWRIREFGRATGMSFWKAAVVLGN